MEKSGSKVKIIHFPAVPLAEMQWRECDSLKSYTEWKGEKERLMSHLPQKLTVLMITCPLTYL